jgi:hypothetical protein
MLVDILRTILDEEKQDIESPGQMFVFIIVVTTLQTKGTCKPLWTPEDYDPIMVSLVGLLDTRYEGWLESMNLLPDLPRVRSYQRERQ